FGAEREAYERLWPDPLRTALVRALLPYPGRLRTFLWERVSRAGEGRAKAGAAVTPDGLRALVAATLSGLRCGWPGRAGPSAWRRGGGGGGDAVVSGAGVPAAAVRRRCGANPGRAPGPEPAAGPGARPGRRGLGHLSRRPGGWGAGRPRALAEPDRGRSPRRHRAHGRRRLSAVPGRPRLPLDAVRPPAPADPRTPRPRLP